VIVIAASALKLRESLGQVYKLYPKTKDVILLPQRGPTLKDASGVDGVCLLETAPKEIQMEIIEVFNLRVVEGVQGMQSWRADARRGTGRSFDQPKFGFLRGAAFRRHPR